MHRSITGTIISGTNVTKKVSNQSVLYFPTSSNYCFCTTWETGKPEIVFFRLMLHDFLPKIHETLKYHLVTAEPPFTVKTIDWVH